MKKTNYYWIGAFCILALGLVVLFSLQDVAAQPSPAELVRNYLWPGAPEARERAQQALEEGQRKPLSRVDLARVEQVLRTGPETFEALPAAGEPGGIVEVEANSPNGAIPVLVTIPPHYSPEHSWPLLVAMHGGPPGSEEQARSGARRMSEVWHEAAQAHGWIVAAPAMLGTVRKGDYTRERLPYEIFHPEDFRAVVDEVRRYLRIDPDRIVSTGISLGSNFSIAFAAAHPDRLAAIVPVSTEGESRQRLLKNLFAVPTYVLEGTRDTNIRTITGPRAMARILAAEAFDHVYLEHSDRAHEGFAEQYPDVLRWLASRPRRLYPRRVLRSPHAGIAPLSRRLYWIESGDAEGLLRAEIRNAHQIDLLAHNTQNVTLYLHDRMVDLDASVQITINGVVVHDEPVARSLETLLHEVERSEDPARVFSARIELQVPRAETAQARGRALLEAFRPEIPKGELSFWEMYAVRSLEERVPELGLTLESRPLPETFQPLMGQHGLFVSRVKEEGLLADSGLKRGDLIVRFGNHHFYQDHPHDLLFHLRRELRSHPQLFAVQLWRDGRRQLLEIELELGGYSGR